MMMVEMRKRKEKRHVERCWKEAQVVDRYIFDSECLVSFSLLLLIYFLDGIFASK